MRLYSMSARPRARTRNATTLRNPHTITAQNSCHESAPSAHTPTHPVDRRWAARPQRYCKVYDSPDMPEADACFCITESGVADIAD